MCILLVICLEIDLISLLNMLTAEWGWIGQKCSESRAEVKLNE